MTLPETAIKRDGSIYPFALYKIEMVLDSLHLTEHEADILPAILQKLNGAKQTSTEKIADAFVQTLIELGFSDEANAYTSRHSFATMMLTLGADLYTTSKLLGHSNVKTTQIYAKIVDSKKVEAVNLVDGVFD